MDLKFSNANILPIIMYGLWQSVNSNPSAKVTFRQKYCGWRNRGKRGINLRYGPLLQLMELYVFLSHGRVGVYIGWHCSGVIPRGGRNGFVHVILN